MLISTYSSKSFVLSLDSCSKYASIGNGHQQLLEVDGDRHLLQKNGSADMKQDTMTKHPTKPVRFPQWALECQNIVQQHAYQGIGPNTSIASQRDERLIPTRRASP